MKNNNNNNIISFTSLLGDVNQESKGKKLNGSCCDHDHSHDHGHHHHHHDNDTDDSESGLEDDLEDWELEAFVEECVTVLMHRDCHFAGNFETMLEYYRGENKGRQEDIDIEWIQKLAETEKQSGENLAEEFLDKESKQQIAQSKEAYKKLKAVYDASKDKNSPSCLIADLILSEDEEAEQEVAAIVAQGKTIVPALIDLMRSEDLYNPLFPGYGMAPGLVAKCLGELGDERAIIPLFNQIGTDNFFIESELFTALKKIGDSAKIFLLKKLKGLPLNQDNERAAFALVEFADDQEVARTFLTMLQDPAIQNKEELLAALITSCEFLKTEEDRQTFTALSENQKFSKEMREEMQLTISCWE